MKSGSKSVFVYDSVKNHGIIIQICKVFQDKPSKMKIEILDNADLVAQRAASIIAAEARTAVATARMLHHGSQWGQNTMENA